MSEHAAQHAHAANGNGKRNGQPHVTDLRYWLSALLVMAGAIGNAYYRDGQITEQIKNLETITAQTATQVVEERKAIASLERRHTARLRDVEQDVVRIMTHIKLSESKR